jgi:hypothetical protein
MHADEKRKLENQLLVMGLKGLTDPELIAQLGSLCIDGGMLAGMLNECDKSKRRKMYEAIRPHLKFKPLPFEHYANFFKIRAENIASQASPVIVGERCMIVKLRCTICAKFKAFKADTAVEAMLLARKAGWAHDLMTEKEFCPKCVRTRAKKESSSPVLCLN